MNNYKPVIGLEVHVELNTKTKMFCRCSADYFGKEPNSNTCPVCLGLPGALPMINEEAINKCIQIGLALNCSINKKSYFERKNYFYPDLAKGFQTSQLALPVAVGGWLIVEDEDGNTTKIRINRVHQEEDTGKLSHPRGVTLIDFNRSSVPLVEIVTEPDFTDSSQIRDYAKKLQQIFRYLGVSNADMERGDMRLEANVSVRPVKSVEISSNGAVIPAKAGIHSDKKTWIPDQARLAEATVKRVRDDKQKGQDDNYLSKDELPPYRVELKNINSFRFMVAAVEFEIARQIKLYQEGREDELRQETRGWNEEKKETYLQRSKEDAHDYRYFPEPDLSEMKITADQIERISADLPELPQGKIKKYEKGWNIKLTDAKILAEEKGMAEFFERAVEYGQSVEVEPQAIANYIINQKIDLIDTDPKLIVDDIKAKKSVVIDDEGQIEIWAKEVITENPGMVTQYKAGKETVIMALVGGVMKKSQGKANAVKVKDILVRLLNNE